MSDSLNFALRSFAILVFLLMAACAEKAVLPSQRMMTPVVSGGFLKGQADLRGVGTIDAVMVDDLSSTAPSYEAEVSENSDFGIGFSLGLLSRVDLYVHDHLIAESRYGLKWQILGPTLQGTREGWVLAVNAGFGTQSTETRVESSLTAREGTAETNLSSIEYGVSVGNWIRPNLLLYGGGGKSSSKANTRFKQTDVPATTTLINEKIKGEGEIDTFNIGFIFGNRFYLHGEFLYTKAHWTKKEPDEESTDKWEGTQYGGGLGYHW